MVAHSDAHVHPLAVVVESLHAFVANVAMPRVLGSQDAAGGADVAGVEVLVEFQEGDITRWSHRPRVGGTANEERNYRKSEAPVEYADKVGLRDEGEYEELHQEKCNFHHGEEKHEAHV